MIVVRIVDDEPEARELFADFVEKTIPDSSVIPYAHPQEVLAELNAQSAEDVNVRPWEGSVLLLDLCFSRGDHGRDAFALLDALHKRPFYRRMVKVIITAFGEINYVRRAFRDFYVDDFIEKPVTLKVFRPLYENRIHPTLNLINESEQLHLSHFNMIGKSEAMQAVYRLIGQVSDTNATVLIRGESGTGKELVAQAIHYNSLRADKPFVKVNCTALSPTLVESELFGHEKGAFTGAAAKKIGRFEKAHGGTIFLDEIGDFSQDLQAKLLRVVQFKAFERVGGGDTIKTNVRIVAATHKNLEERIKEDLFREDLYYRMNGFPIYMPPLRERKDDIKMLVSHFIMKFGEENGKSVTRISPNALKYLINQDWRGNVRELENAIERAVIQLEPDGDEIHLNHVTSDQFSVSPRVVSTSMPTLTDAKEDAERTVLMKAEKKLAAKEFNTREDAAHAVGVTYKHYLSRLKKYGLYQKL